MKIYNIYLYILIILVGHVSMAQVPSHESKIIMLGNTSTSLYSLDRNALLRIYNKKNSTHTFTIPIRTNITQAMFHFPYIILIDQDSTMHIYDTTNQFIVFNAPFLTEPMGTVAFSKNNELFVFTGENAIHVINTNSWTEINSFLYLDSPTKFLFLSQTQNNLLNINHDNVIEYRNLIDGNVFKIEESEISIHAPILNSNLRFAIGYNDTQLHSMDILSGLSTHSVPLQNPIVNLFSSSQNNPLNINNDTIIHVITRDTTDSYQIHTLSINSQGTIIPNDLLTIHIAQPISCVTSEDNVMYVGLDNGEVWQYNLSDIHSAHDILIEDTTYAIYDTLYIPSTLLLSTTEGILSLPINITNPTLPPRVQLVQNQPLQNPHFIHNLNEGIENQYTYLISSNTPYNATTSPLTTSIEPTPSQTQEDSSLSLLFSLPLDSLQLSNPTKILPQTSLIQIDNNFRLEYSALNSNLRVATSDDNIDVPIFNSHFLFGINHIQDTSILWTNTQISQEETPNSLDSNTIYSYTLGTSLTQAFPPLSLPFIKNEMLYFQLLQFPFALIIEYNPQSQLHSILLTEIPTTPVSSSLNNENTPIMYPTKVNTLSHTVFSDILKIIPIGTTKDKVLIFTEDDISLMAIDIEKKNFLYEYRIPYPPTFGGLLNAQVSMINTQTFVITMIDTNNSVSMMTFQKEMGFTSIANMNILTNNTVKSH